MRIALLTSLLSISFCFTILFGCGTEKETITAPVITEAADAQSNKLSLFKKLKENNHLPIEDRITLYHKLKKDSPNDYRFKNDRELNQYGYSLLQDGKTKEAVEIFKLLVSEFPDLANAYDSLGEGYLKDGNDELALVNYEKSVALNPKNHAAMDQITILKGMELLVTDWGKEFFHFPIHFAPEIPYLGVEEVVFPKGWRKPESDDFWSYVFVWSIENKKEVTAFELEENLKLYFDGLMEGVQHDSTIVMNKTEVHFKRNTIARDNVDFVGDLTIFDAFATDSALTLNARIHTSYCEKDKKITLLFRFSPKDFNHPIWEKLRTVKLRSPVCER